MEKMVETGGVLVGAWVEGEGGGGGMGDNREGETFVFRQILVSFAQRSNPRSPSTAREKIQGSQLITKEQRIKTNKQLGGAVKHRADYFMISFNEPVRWLSRQENTPYKVS